MVDQRPLGAEMVLGMSGISALGGVTVRSPVRAQFCAAAVRAALTVDAPDFSVQFDPGARKWTVAWKWTDGRAPDCLGNTVAEYSVPRAVRQEYDAELDAWVAKGWLVPHDERRHGPARGLVPLLAVQQTNQAKVRPVMDFRELNGFVTAHTADSDVCADMLRRWRRHGANVAIVDLRKAYLQLHVQQQLWPFQTVVVRGQRYCLTRLGFGLSVAPQVMKAVVRAVLEQDASVGQAVLPYVDDLLVNEDIVSAEQVIEHFGKYGLECKPPERAAAGTRLLGLRVRAEDSGLRWMRDNAIGPPPARVTRRAVFAWCGRLVAHLPVCGWLRPAAAWLKRRVNDSTRGWDDVTGDSSLIEQMNAVAARLVSDDPARGVWCVEGERAVVWTDASSLATGVVVELPSGGVIEDACWLRSDESAHINMAELDAAIRGVNLAVAWGMRVIELRTDSATVYRWMDDALTGRARLRTKAHGEMLIRRRVDIIRQLAAELGLDLSVVLIRSAENLADVLTRVPRGWLSGAQHVRVSDCSPVTGRPTVPAASVAGVGADSVSAAERDTGAASAAERDAGAASVAGRAACAVSVTEWGYGATAMADRCASAACVADRDVSAASAAERDAGAASVAGGGADSVSAVERDTDAASAAERGVGAASAAEQDAGAVSAAVRPQVSVAVRDADADAVAEVHVSAGHPGVRRTLYFARRSVGQTVTRAQARAAVLGCDVCRAIDPAPVKWRHGTLSVPESWQRLAIDMTHYRGQCYLTIVDCGPARYSLWRPLRREDCASVVHALEEVFFERGAPAELLCDNGTVFRSRNFATLAVRWQVSLRFRAAYVPSGNGIVERNHRTVKVIAARKQCSVAEAVHLYNVSPHDGQAAATSPAGLIYRYAVRDCVRPEDDRSDSAAPEFEPGSAEAVSPTAGVDALAVGDVVWVRQRGTRCSERSKRGTVTELVSRQVVDVDGMPRHVRDLRRCVQQASPCSARAEEEDELPLFVDVPMPQVNVPTPQVNAPTPQVNVPTPSTVAVTCISEVAVPRCRGEPVLSPVLRRSKRARKQPKRWCCDHDDQEGV